MKCYLITTETDEYITYIQDDNTVNLSSINHTSKFYEVALVGFFPNGIVTGENCVLLVTNVMEFEKAMNQLISKDTPIVAYMLGIVKDVQELQLAGAE